MNNSLYHFGVKGMKWGVRRGNKLTADNYRQMKNATEDTKNAINTTKSAVNKAPSKEAKQRVRQDLSKMSDKELQQVLNRLNMEERYSSIMSSRYEKPGRARANRILDSAGTALAVGSSALSIMVAIKTLKG